MNLLIKNIKGLVQYGIDPPAFRKGSKMAHLPVLKHAYVWLQNGLIREFGSMSDLQNINPDVEIDAAGCFVLPGYVDSHTHLVFPNSREDEFVMKIKGASYEEIAAKGGGILNSANKLRGISEEELLNGALSRLDEVIRMGTSAIEIKSGYGLSSEGELKMLRVIKKLKKVSPIPLKATFLGAHAIPSEFKSDKNAYIKLIINEMLPEIHKEKLADYIDIFIEKGFYSIEDALTILDEAVKYGLKPRLHVDQINNIGGIPFAVSRNAVSVDHLEQTGIPGMETLLGSTTIPTLLPSCSFYLNMRYPDARTMIDKGLGVSIASDYNPGSSPSGNLNFSMSLACIKMKMMPEEAINAVTVNASYALEVNDILGSITAGKMANLIITKPMSSIGFIPYSFGNHVVDKMIINGNLYHGIDA